MRKYFNSALNQSLGDLTTWKEDQYGLTGETTCVKFRILLYNQNTVRLQITRDHEFEDFSYAVEATPIVESFSILDQTENIVLKTSALVLTIAKSPVRFSFYTVHDQLINEDDDF